MTPILYRAPRRCPWCQHWFTPWRKDMIYCKKSHRNAASAARVRDRKRLQDAKPT